MWTNLESYDGPREIHGDLCVIGAGAAGITIARALRDSKLDVVLLESGGFEFDVASHHLYLADLHADLRTDVVDYPILLMHRLRYFGGTTNHWIGRSRPLEREDLAARPWVPHSGWPLDYDELAPYYAPAAETCQIRPFDYDPATELAPQLPLLDLRGSVDVETKVFHYSPPTRFGVEYREQVTQARNVRVFLRANVTELVPDEPLRRIERIRAVSLGGRRLEVRARAFVLATGGIENARILLNSDAKMTAGIGNRHGLVGRYFMDHPHLTVGDVLFTDPRTNLELYSHSVYSRRLDQVVHGVFATSRAFQEREQILSCYLQPSNTTRPIQGLSRLERSFVRAAGTLDDALEGGVRPAAPLRLYRLLARSEQAPNPESRVVLTTERDQLGMRKVELYWRLTELDRRTWIRSVEMLGKQLGQLFLGRARTIVREDAWPDGEMGAHHSGTTRMSRDPGQGVVDADCRVHGMANLYVAGSSVFPTIGFANPTLTIVALSLRLADHLGRELGGQVD